MMCHQRCLVLIFFLNFPTGSTLLQRNIDRKQRFSFALTLSSPSTASFPAPAKEETSRFSTEGGRKNDKQETKRGKSKPYAKFEDMMERLEEFYQQHKHSFVSHDDDPELHEWMDRIRRNYRHQYRGWSEGRVQMSAGRWKRLEAVEFSWVLSEAQWEHRFAQLKAYQDQNGHLNVFASSPLGHWTRYQRIQREKGLLSDERQARLNSLGFLWTNEERLRTKTRKPKEFDALMDRLEEFYAKYQHTNVSPDDDLELCDWVQKIRRRYRHQYRDQRSLKTRLPNDCLERLEAVNFRWNQHDAVWDEKFVELRTFLDLGRSDLTDVPKLNNWVRYQRRQARLKEEGLSSSMTEERATRLDSLGFKWSASHAEEWNIHYNNLKKFHQEHGHVNVPQDYPELGTWCMNQRTQYRLKQMGGSEAMTTARIAKLEELNFVWKSHESRWWPRLERLRSYQEKFKSLKISTADHENQDLRVWVNLQRYMYRKGRLSSKRVQALEAIEGFSWKGRESNGPNTEDWEKLFDAMREKGIRPDAPKKRHWFDGVDRFAQDVKSRWTEDDLMALWNQQDDDDDDDEDMLMEYM